MLATIQAGSVGFFGPRISDFSFSLKGLMEDLRAKGYTEFMLDSTSKEKLKLEEEREKKENLISSLIEVSSATEWLEGYYVTDPQVCAILNETTAKLDALKQTLESQAVESGLVYDKDLEEWEVAA